MLHNVMEISNEETVRVVLFCSVYETAPAPYKSKIFTMNANPCTFTNDVVWTIQYTFTAEGWFFFLKGMLWSLPPVPVNVALFESKIFEGIMMLLTRTLRWSLIQYEHCLHKKKELVACIPKTGAYGKTHRHKRKMVIDDGSWDWNNVSIRQVVSSVATKQKLEKARNDSEWQAFTATLPWWFLNF